MRLYVAFSSADLFGSTQTYPLHHPDQHVLSNQEMLRAIQDRCKGVEFVGQTAPEQVGKTAEKMESDLENLDGLLYFGTPSSDLLDLGLPIIAVYPLWSQWQYPYDGFVGRRVLTACLPIIPDGSEAVFSSRLDRIAQHVRLLEAAAGMKGLTVLIVTDKPILGEFEPTPLQIGEEGWEGYQTRYLENLTELGTEVVTRPQDELVSRMKTVDEAEAARVASTWMAEAAGIKGTNEAEIRASARLYLVMKDMLEEYHADAITTEDYGVWMHYKDGPIPSQGMPSSQLCTDGVVATSETLVDSLVTQQLGLFVTGSTGFNGDYVVDEDN